MVSLILVVSKNRMDDSRMRELLSRSERTECTVGESFPGDVCGFEVPGVQSRYEVRVGEDRGYRSGMAGSTGKCQNLSSISMFPSGSARSR